MLYHLYRVADSGGEPVALTGGGVRVTVLK